MRLVDERVELCLFAFCFIGGSAVGIYTLFSRFDNADKILRGA
jgi:hypothetical protein